MGFPVRLLGPDERPVLMLRPHAKVLLGPLAVLLGTAPTAGLLVGMAPAGDAGGVLRWGVVLVAAVVVGRWVLWPFLVWFNTLYLISDRRLITRQGVFSRTGHDMPLTRLDDVKFSHNVVERVLGCGDLVVECAAEAGLLVLDDVPRVEQVQRTLYRLSDEARRRPPSRRPAQARVPAGGGLDGPHVDRSDVGLDPEDAPDDEVAGVTADGDDETWDELLEERDEQSTLVLRRRRGLGRRRGEP